MQTQHTAASKVPFSSHYGQHVQKPLETHQWLTQQEQGPAVLTALNARLGGKVPFCSLNTTSGTHRDTMYTDTRTLWADTFKPAREFFSFFSYRSSETTWSRYLSPLGSGSRTRQKASRPIIQIPGRKTISLWESWTQSEATEMNQIYEPYW